MSSLDDLLAQLPIAKIADQLGIDVADVERATQQAVPALVQGMQANAQDEAGAVSLAQALAQHAKRVAAAQAADDLDADDGERIVSHVFGDNKDQVVSQLGGLGGGSDLFKKLLPMLAPLVMGFLAKQATGTKDARSAAPDADDEGGLGGLLGGLLGGGGGGGGGGLSDMLGGLLGGGGGGGGGGGLGDLLGGLLGGGRR